MTFKRQKVKPKNTIDLKEQRLSLIIDTVNSTSLKFAVWIISQEPSRISRRAGKSNLQMNTSFKKTSANITCTTIAVAEFAERSTISANGEIASKNNED
jgi:hypothetical protein